MANYLPVLLVSVTTNAIPDDSSLSTQPRGQVDYLSYEWREEDVCRSWRNMTRQKNEIANGVRLENASWRTWWKQRNKLKTVSPETLNWCVLSFNCPCIFRLPLPFMNPDPSSCGANCAYISIFLVGSKIRMSLGFTVPCTRLSIWNHPTIPRTIPQRSIISRLLKNFSDLLRPLSNHLSCAQNRF